MNFHLLALLACTGESPVDSADTPDSDSAGTLDSDGGADLGEWQPGDPIPGWPSGECFIPDDVIADGYGVEWPEEIYGLVLRRRSGTPAWGAGLSRNLCGEENPTCIQMDGESTQFSVGTVIRPEHLGVTLHFETPEECAENAAGSVPSLHGRLADQEPDGHRDLEVVDYCETSWINVHLYACLSELRPDRTRGVAWFRSGAERGYRGVSYYYAEFDSIRQPGLAYYDGDAAEVSYTKSELAKSAYYFLPYDEAWPWDSITDDAVRERVYELYAPIDPENEPE